MFWNVAAAVLIPFLGTSLGSACVFFMKKQMRDGVKRALSGFAAGIMVSASFFSLILPALNMSEESMGRLAFIPVITGFLIGMLFLLMLDVLVPHIHLDKSEEGPKTGLKKTTKLLFAVTLHNLPEGMAVGVVLAGWLKDNTQIPFISALILSLGIALQNFPEGAIVSMPLRAEGMKKGKTFLYGMLSGIVEPIGALLMILFTTGPLLTLLPYFLAFAAGAMFYVVVEELVPDMSEGGHSNIGIISFALGFILMMGLDVGLG